jgi:hypothetical protein
MAFGHYDIKSTSWLMTGLVHGGRAQCGVATLYRFNFAL